MQRNSKNAIVSVVLLLGLLVSFIQPVQVTARPDEGAPIVAPDSLSGSFVQFDPAAGGDVCYIPGATQTFCFESHSYTNDWEYVYNQWMKFPLDWTVINAYVQGTPSCTGGGTWNDMSWIFETEPNEVNIYHSRFQAYTDDCVATYCFEVVPGAPEPFADASWYWHGDGYNAAPHHPCSADGYTPPSMIYQPCDEAVNPVAQIPVCAMDPGVYLLPETQNGASCNGTPLIYDMAVYNATGVDATFDLSYAVIDGLGTLTGPATVFAANGAVGEFQVTLTPDICAQPDDTVVGQVSVSGEGYSDTALINHIVNTGAGCPVCDLQGFLEGTVLDGDGTGAPCTDATVTINPGNFVLPVDPATGAYGPFELVQGDYVATAEAPGFTTEVVTVTIVDELITTQDFTLYRPVLEYDPVGFTVGSPYSVPLTIPLTINNLGSLPLEWSLFDFGAMPLNASFNTKTVQVPAQAADKLDADLAQELTSGSVDFFVWMVEKADLSPAYQLKTKEEKGQFVFNALTSVADRTQRDLRARLDQMGVEYEPYYIANKILVKGGTQALALDIASRSDVYRLSANHPFQLEEPMKNYDLQQPSGIEPNLTFIKVDQVWALGITGEGTVMAGNDTGLDETVSTIAPHYRGCLNPPTCTSWDHNYNWWDATGTYPSNPYDGFGHGTHTTGTMVGDDGGANQIGVAPGAQTVHCKNMTDGGSGDDGTFTECFQWDLAPWDLSGANPDPAMAPDSVNNSWGYWGGGAPQFEDEIAALHAAGVLVEVSAGNEGTGCGSLRSPGDYVSVLTTGSVDHNGVFPGTITGFSSRGPSSLYPSEYFPDIMAPGNNVRSQLPGGSFEYWSGTSMAGPHATALIGLIWSAVPALRGNVEATIDVIHQSAVPLTGQNGSNCGGDYTVGPNNDWGFGTIDALATIELAQQSADLPWVTEDPITGTLEPAGSQVVNVTFLCTQEQAGEHLLGNLRIESNDPCNDAVDIPLDFYCQDLANEPIIQVNLVEGPLETELCSDTTDTIDFEICNIGGITLTWEAVEAPLADWFNVNPTSGSLASNTCVTVTAAFDAAGLTPGDYALELQINNNSVTPQVPLPVNLTVIEPADIGDVTFTANNLEVTFTATVTGTGALTYLWDFGDGTTSDVPNPVHTYVEGGCYDVFLTLENECGFAIWTGPVCVCDPITGADFTWTPLEPFAGHEVLFAATVMTGTEPFEFEWNFGDGITGTGITTTHTFATTGDYTVTLEVSNECGSVVVTYVVTAACEPLEGVDFFTVPAEPRAGDEVVFEGTWVTGTEPVDFLWDFGDGLGITDTHVFTAAGSYTVTMVAMNACTEPVTVVKVITVLPPCEPLAGVDFTWTPDPVFSGETVSFAATVMTGTEPFDFDWLITDAFTGTPDITGTGQTFDHMFTVEGVYTVTLTATNPCGTARVVYSLTVSPPMPPFFNAYLPVILKATVP